MCVCVCGGEEQQWGGGEGGEGGGVFQTRLSGEQMTTYFWLISDPIFFFHKRLHPCNHLLKSICLPFSNGWGGVEGRVTFL